MSYYILFPFLLIVLSACGPNIPDDFFHTPEPGKYDSETVEYLFEIGLCPEFDRCDHPMIKKWVSDVRIHLHGEYTDSDEEELNDIISELSKLTSLNISRVTGNANINIYIVKQSEFQRYIPQYKGVERQQGLFYVSINNNGVIDRATICVEDGLEKTLKHHLLREELTQTMGLLADSYKYPESVFQQNPSYIPTEYAGIDRAVIQLLYDNKIRPGMVRQEVTQVLQSSVSVASN